MDVKIDIEKAAHDLTIEYMKTLIKGVNDPDKLPIYYINFYTKFYNKFKEYIK